MKKIVLLLLSTIITISVFGQTPIRYAPIASPAFTGTPTVPTASTATSNTQAASTAFVQNNFTANAVYFASGTFTGAGTSGSPFALGTSNAYTWSNTQTFSAINVSGLTASSAVFTDASKNLTSTGTVAIANGGTGSSTQNFVDLTTTQSIGGTKTFSASPTLSAGANSGGAINVSIFSGSSNAIYNGSYLLNSFTATSGSSASPASPAYAQQTSVWNTTSAAVNYINWKQQVFSVSGTAPTSTFKWSSYLGTSSTTPVYVDKMALDGNTGNLSLLTGELIPHGTLNAINSTGTASALQLSGGVITSTSAAATTITLPTATLMATQIGAAQGTTFEFTIDNTAGASTVTIALGSGMTQLTTITGANTLTVPSGTAGVGVWRLYFSSATACNISRIE